VLIIHQWKGLSDYEKKRAEMLAGLGYTVFAVGQSTARAFARRTRRKPARRRANTRGTANSLRARAKGRSGRAREERIHRPETHRGHRLLFGGTAVIELARSGADIAGVVSHGGLDSPNPADGKNIKCKVLALHGADDPFVPAKDVAGL